MEVQQAFRTLRDLPPGEFMASFARYQLKPGVKPPPPPDGPPPSWMAKRPAGLTAFIAAFDKAQLDLACLRRFERPVDFALGGSVTLTTLAVWPSAFAMSFPTSRWRPTRNATTSIRHIASSRRRSPEPCANCGAVRNPYPSQDN